VFGTAPEGLVASVSVLVKSLLFVEIAKLFESVAVTVMFPARLLPPTVKFVLGPKLPCVAVSNETVGGAAERVGGGTTLPATVTLFEAEPLTKVIVLLLVPSGAPLVRRTKIEVGATEPDAFVNNVS
jgi:hypothetical protein